MSGGSAEEMGDRLITEFGPVVSEVFAVHQHPGSQVREPLIDAAIDRNSGC